MKNRTNVRWLTQLALLVAILLVLNYTPLGYLQIGPLSASLLTVPVAIGAMTMNPMAGAILGGVFGATSFIQAVEGKSAMGAALFQVSPAGTFVVCFVARVLMGLCTALIFNALRKAMPKNEKLACFLGGLSAPVLRRLVFLTTQVAEDSTFDWGAAGMPPIKAVKMATTVLSTLPILCIYPFVQKFFTQGVMVGSVKG